MADVHQFPSPPGQRPLSREASAPYGSGGGDGMDRIGALEKRMDGVEVKIDKLDDRVRGVEIGLATLIERVAHLPSKGFIVTALMACLAFIAAMIGFADQIQTLVGQTPGL